jgi:uncharacterized phage protein gp47/JayE
VATFDASGLAISTQAEILTEIEAAEIAEIAAGLDLSTSSPIGQINRIIARRLRLLEEALAALFAGIDPDTATGDALLRLCALTGTYREPATASRVVVTVDLDAGTYAAGSLACYPAGRPEDRFVNAEEVTTAGGVSDVIFDAETTGPIVANADTLVLVPSAGFNSITTHPDATPGAEIETEASLRLRRAAEVASPGSASAAGIAADLTREVEAIETVQIIANATDATVDSIPPHSVEAIVYGPASPTAGDNDAVAASIFSSLAAGIGTYGNVTRTVYDDEGIGHSISFTRPADVAISVAISITRSASGYAGDSAVAEAVATLSRVRPGLNATWSAVVAKAMSVAGVLRVSTVNLGAGAFVDVPITTREIAVFDSGTVTVTSSIGVP